MEATDHFRAALRIEPNDAEVHNNLGISLARLGDTRGAISHFRKALRINPGHALARDNLETLQVKQHGPVEQN